MIATTPVMHQHGDRFSECSFWLVDLPCGCQDAHYACGYIDHEHDHVECPGQNVVHSVGLAENDARAALSQALSGLQADMLIREEDITDNAVWRAGQTRVPGAADPAGPAGIGQAAAEPGRAADGMTASLYRCAECQHGRNLTAWGSASVCGPLDSKGDIESYDWDEVYEVHVDSIQCSKRVLTGSAFSPGP